MSIQKVSIFSPRFNNEELENKVNEFFNYNGLLPLFTNEQRANHIQLSYIEAKELINPNSKKSRVLKEFGEHYLQIGQDNKSYEEALFKILYESRSLTGMVNKIARYNAYIKNQIGVGYLHNTWNIVWYNKELK